MQCRSPEWFPGFEKPDEIDIRREIELRFTAGTRIGRIGVPRLSVDPPADGKIQPVRDPRCPVTRDVAEVGRDPVGLIEIIIDVEGRWFDASNLEVFM